MVRAVAVAALLGCLWAGVARAQPGDAVATPPSSSAAARPGIPWKMDALFSLGVGHVSDVPDFGSDVEVRGSLLGRWGVLAVEPYAQGGLGFHGGFSYDAGLRGGLAFGDRDFFGVLGGVSSRGVTGGRLGQALDLNVTAVGLRRLNRRFSVSAELGAHWVASSVDHPDGTHSRSSFDLELAGRLLLERRWLAVGVEVRQLGGGLAVTGLVAAVAHMLE